MAGDDIMTGTDEYKIYIIISQTGTILSKLLKIITGAKYNHSSISLMDDLDTMYSFGRRCPYNPIWGGFVRESINYGTFKRFWNTDVVVMKIPVEKEVYLKMEEFLEKMYLEKNKYKYNYMGLFLAAIPICYTSENHYYCSEFVRDVLIRFQIVQEGEFSRIVKPIQFLENFEQQVIYSGKLRNFARERFT